MECGAYSMLNLGQRDTGAFVRNAEHSLSYLLPEKLEKFIFKR